MIVILPDDEISQLLAEVKTLPRNFRDKLGPIDAGGHLRAQIELVGVTGRKYLIYVRQLLIDRSNFSVGLIWKMPSRDFRLRRYNGPWQPHTNKLERERFTAAHIHTATHRSTTV